MLFTEIELHRIRFLLIFWFPIYQRLFMLRVSFCPLCYILVTGVHFARWEKLNKIISSQQNQPKPGPVGKVLLIGKNPA